MSDMVKDITIRDIILYGCRYDIRDRETRQFVFKNFVEKKDDVMNAPGMGVTNYSKLLSSIQMVQNSAQVIDIIDQFLKQDKENFKQDKEKLTNDSKKFHAGMLLINKDLYKALIADKEKNPSAMMDKIENGEEWHNERNSCFAPYKKPQGGKCFLTENENFPFDKIIKWYYEMNISTEQYYNVFRTAAVKLKLNARSVGASRASIIEIASYDMHKSVECNQLRLDLCNHADNIGLINYINLAEVLNMLGWYTLTDFTKMLSSISNIFMDEKKEELCNHSYGDFKRYVMQFYWTSFGSMYNKSLCMDALKKFGVLIEYTEYLELLDQFQKCDVTPKNTEFILEFYTKMENTIDKLDKMYLAHYGPSGCERCKFSKPQNVQLKGTTMDPNKIETKE